MPIKPVLLAQDESMHVTGAAQPSSPNYRVEDQGTSLRITIPPPEPAAVGCLVGLIYLAAWVIGGLFLSALLGELMDALFAPTAFIRSMKWLLWLTLFAGFTAGQIWSLWSILRYEVVEVTPRSISVARQLFGLGWRAQVPAEQIETLRVVRVRWWSPLLGWSFRRRNWFSEWFRGNGWNSYWETYWGKKYALAMDSGRRTIRFGEGLNEAEAKAILGLIRSRYPQWDERLMA